MAISEKTQDVAIKSLKKKFNWVVFKAQAAEFVERAVPIVTPPLLITAGFLALSWTGFWGAVPTLARIAGSLAFAGAAAASPFIFADKSPLVTRKDAIKRIDKNANSDTENPAETLGGKIADDSTPVEKLLWKMNLLDTWKRWAGKLEAGKPKPAMKLVTPFKAAVLGLAVIAGTFISNDRVGDVKSALDWRFPETVVATAEAETLDIKGFIAPPKKIDIDPIIFDSKMKDHRNGGKKLYFHEQSKLTIMVMEKEAEITVNGQALPLTKTMTSGTRRDPKTTYVYEMDLETTDIDLVVKNGPSLYFYATADEKPLAEINGIEFGTDGDQSLNIEYTIDDDVGVREGKIRMKLSGDEDSEKKKPLPSTTLAPVPVN